MNFQKALEISRGYYKVYQSTSIEGEVWDT